MVKSSNALPRASQIESTGERFSKICLTATIILPIAFVLFWISSSTSQLMQSLHITAFVSGDLNPMQNVTGFVVSFIPVAAIIFVLYSLHQLFRLYGQGVFFSISNVKALRGAGLGLIFHAIANFVTTPLQTFIFTYQNAPGQRELSVGVSSDMLLALLMGATFFALALVMNEARQINDDHALTV